MTDQQNFEAVRPGSADPDVALAKALGQWPPKAPRRKLSLKDLKAKPAANGAAKTSVEELAEEVGLTLGEQAELTIRRVKRGKSYSFTRANGTTVRDPATIRRLKAMAMPPAYREVRYSPDPNSHLQAV